MPVWALLRGVRSTAKSSPLGWPEAPRIPSKIECSLTHFGLARGDNDASLSDLKTAFEKRKDETEGHVERPQQVSEGTLHIPALATAEAVYAIIYLLLILLPISGAVAWFAGVKPVGSAHALLTNALLGAIALHIAGALFQHFIRRSSVLMRMFRPEGARHRA